MHFQRGQTRWVLAFVAGAASMACAVEGGQNDEDGSSSSEDAGTEGSSSDDTTSADTTSADTGTADDTTTGGDCPTDVEFEDVDESPCAPLASDFVPGSADDPYGDCVADSGEWTLIGGAPSTAARVEAYEQIVEILRGGATPEPAAFTEARALYATDSGLESRVLRREDTHYPPIPAADQDPTVSFDQQCTILDNAESYPDRCVGPAKMSPLLDAAFLAGETGEGDANVHAARIDATLQWFLFVSAYKESASCVELPDNCDSSWAYYGGATDRESPIGFGASVREISPMAHDMIYDGELAMLCWRDLYPGDADPTWDELPAEGQSTFEAAHEQLDNALWYGWARLVRSHIEQQPAVCGSEADANWAFLQIAGPVLDPEAERRDAAASADLTDLWTADAPTTEQLQAAVAALDAIFPCPQCESCEVTAGWGY